MDKKHCAGCIDDFYNHRQNFDGNECWMLKDAKLEKRLLIHRDACPPYKGLKPKAMPTCYKAQYYVTVKPEAISKDGFWAR